MGIPREYYKEILLLSRSFEDSLSYFMGLGVRRCMIEPTVMQHLSIP